MVASKQKSTPKKEGKAQIDYVMTANFAYGPFGTRKVAATYRKKVAAVSGVTVTPVKKSVSGYKFTGKLTVGCAAADKDKTYKLVQSMAPTATVSVRKV